MNVRRQKIALILTAAAMSIFYGLLAPTAVSAQQIIGTPGSANSTVVLDGKQLPPPPMPFGGVIKESAKDSTPYWPPRVVPPRARPTSFSL